MKAVIFDMDGVLFDTERLYIDGWNQVAKKRGIEGIEEVAVQCIGRNRNDSRQVMYDKYGPEVDFDPFREAVDVWVKNRIKIYGLPVKAGVDKILAYLKMNQIPVGLATSASYQSTLQHLRAAGLEEYFRVIVTGDMIEHSKPAPDIYQLACRKMGESPAEVYAIEDSYNGIRAAYRAGLCPIMVPDMVEPDDEMRQLCYRICRDLNEVIQVIQG